MIRSINKPEDAEKSKKNQCDILPNSTKPAFTITRARQRKRFFSYPSQRATGTTALNFRLSRAFLSRFKGYAGAERESLPYSLQCTFTHFAPKWGACLPRPPIFRPLRAAPSRPAKLP